MADEWKVQIKGERCSRDWEISVVRLDNHHGQESWGWIDSGKLLVSHNGGPCRWPIKGFVWDCQVVIAHELCRRLNAGESIDELAATHGPFLDSPSINSPSQGSLP